MPNTPLHAQLLYLSEHNIVYALIDGVCHNDVAGYAAECEARGEAAPVVDLSAHPHVSPDAVPHMVQVSPRFAGFLTREVWATGGEGAAPAWGLLFEPHPSIGLSDLIAHWRRWYHVLAPVVIDGEATLEKMIFRFWDARLIGAFLEVATAEERAAFFGPVARILLPQADGSMVPVEGEAAPCCGLHPDTPFTMRPEHMTALEVRRLELRLPAFRAYLEKHFEDGMLRHAGEDRDGFIRAGLKQAGEHGFLSERSAVGWLSLQVLHGPDFDTVAPWARDILAQPERTIGTTDRQDRLIDAGFAAAQPSKEKEHAHG